jgi:hypothetical protein
MANTSRNNLKPQQQQTLLATLRERFEENKGRHKNIQWAPVEAKLLATPAKLWTISEMERTSGEPDVIGEHRQTGQYIFCDCSAESPKGRRSLCYDKKAWEERKEDKPKDNVLDMAAAMGIDLLNEKEYRILQELGSFDTKTSSWLATPAPIRKLGGAIFGDRRYDHVFIYHNGAQSYYAARGFRGIVKL